MLVRNERSGVGGCGRREIILKSYLNCLRANKDIEVFKKPFSDLLSPNRTSSSKRKRKNKRKSLIPTRNTQSRKHLHATPLNPLSKSPPKAPHPFTPKTAPFKEPIPKTLLHESQRHQVLHKVYQQKEKGIVIEQFVKKVKMFRRGCEKEDRKDRCSFEKSEEDRNDELERMVKQSSFRDVSMVYANMKPKIMDGSVPEILERVRRVRKPKYLPKSQIFAKTKNSSKFLNTTLVIPKHPENPIPTSDYIKRGSGDNPSNPSFQTTSYKNPTILISLNPPKLNPKNTKKHSKVTFIPSKSS
ncbi:unnamed protein product [Moneuplotes crassus]|uniref:Uncharacterized protein n=1 Tax=Euplotes crassus TaxID=5936 RepID=A0AAD1X4U0_EUPCR|nr:unnamed protein product [Moneuplotes crassus]